MQAIGTKKKKVESQKTMDAYTKKAPPKKKEADPKRKSPNPEKEETTTPPTAVIDDLPDLPKKDLNSLLVFSDTPLDSLKAYEQRFKQIAKVMMHDYVLRITDLQNKKHEYRLCELEFYYNHPKYHPDVFTHSQKEQNTPAQWYFHRDNWGKGWKTGTYKGLDFTFGMKGNDDYGGVLIRCIERLSDKKVFEGPCVCVIEILSKFGKQEVKELMEDTTINFKNTHVDSTNKWMALEPKTNLAKPPFFLASGRVGLSMKTKFEKDDPFQYLMRNLRFLTFKPKKGKAYLATALIHAKDEANLKLCATPKLIEDCKANIEKGKKMKASEFYGKKWDSDSQIATIFGFSKTIEK